MPFRSVNNANYLITSALTHKQKVQSLYKRAIRNIEDWNHPFRAEARFQSILMRQRFDANKNIKDMREAKRLLAEGEKELWDNMHYAPYKFPYSPGGVCFERYYETNDLVLDYWHPLEKAQYPHYFARREQRKLEYIKLYESDYGNALEVLGINKHVNYSVSFAHDQKADDILDRSPDSSHDKISDDHKPKQIEEKPKGN
ncbi:NADH dehydrogenase [ubiquinone] 1 beta subcomplex subunit 9-like protein [Dinothrombium tinctorium]|uniref:NADH dehydrogenase [ubiquinone] 1 beta subcomplex subunit 9 n=1 Tax=Dinothrombium tinctorium TaxID=1965070 RepID=A0A443RC63_9ACAR|nr:NADH dehydrogenase [ubiquinone] 1 beta subcomplex subunit 9-like protein [Dinothrombium tinctorium]RWS12862.1 NADH dehydrogenase [ubiquinone] 1 beta subcomplex subunit 9-like protein [Dinothrombium tinctorium]